MSEDENCFEPGAALDDALLFGSPETRRLFLQQLAGTGAAIMIGQQLISSAQAAEHSVPSSAEAASAEAVDVELSINGQPIKMRVDPRVTLLDALRDRLGLTGAKKGCDHGQCGACTVLVNGRRINACLSLVATHAGDEITTIEGLAEAEQLHPLQSAFIAQDGFQCGYCTPGQICSGVALLKEGHAGSDEEIREWMSGNLCRCGAYTNIVAAIREAHSKTPIAL